MVRSLYQIGALVDIKAQFNMQIFTLIREWMICFLVIYFYDFATTQHSLHAKFVGIY